MPPKKFPTVWDAPPHTIAKIEMLQAYLVAWFQILGRKRTSQELLYVDGFAGPGEYKNYSLGSPLAALTAATKDLELTGTGWVAGNIHCAFIEADTNRFKNLQQRIELFEKPAQVVIHTYRKSFTDGLAQLKKDLPLPFQAQDPLFVFIDPFGATGVPFSLVTELLNSRCSEVLINLDADGIARIFHAGEHAAYEQNLNEIFAGDDWKTLLSAGDASSELYRKVLQLYKTKLRSIKNVKYVFSFEMRTTLHALNYYLVFASQHYLGLEKMKEAMKRIDQDGTYCFSDAGTIQSSLFRFDKPEDHSISLFNVFHGRKVGYAPLRDFALNETPFINPKSMLKDLECNRDLIEEVGSTSARRQKGTFNEQKLTFIKFKERR